MTNINRFGSLIRHLSVPLWIVIVNVAVFVGLRLTAIVLRFSASDLSVDSIIKSIIDELMFSSSAGEIIQRPWTVLTYMFVQYDVVHLLINMLWLYAFAAVVAKAVGGRRLLALYIIGGIGGAMGYLAATYLYPSGVGSGLVGASASALAVMGAAMVRCPRQKFNLFFFGEVSLKVLGLIFLVLVVAATGSNKYGVHLAHGGGFAVGLALAFAWKRLDANRRKLRPFIVVQPDGAYQQEKTAAESDASLDQLLDKIRTSGYASLSEAERRQLFKISSNLPNRSSK